MEDSLQKISKISEEQKKELLKTLLKQTFENEINQNVDNLTKIKLLKKLKSIYDEKNEFQVGDIIIWKKQLKNRKLPEYSEPVIVLENLADPIIDQSDEISSQYYNERNDIKIGIYRDDTLLTFYFDSQRFEKYK